MTFRGYLCNNSEKQKLSKMQVLAVVRHSRNCSASWMIAEWWIYWSVSSLASTLWKWKWERDPVSFRLGVAWWWEASIRSKKRGHYKDQGWYLEDEVVIGSSVAPGGLWWLASQPGVSQATPGGRKFIESLDFVFTKLLWPVLTRC